MVQTTETLIKMINMQLSVDPDCAKMCRLQSKDDDKNECNMCYATLNDTHRVISMSSVFSLYVLQLL